MRHLRAYLLILEPGSDCEVLALRDLESVENGWRSRKSIDAAAALHIGFWRPDTEAFSSALSAHPGKVLLSEAAVGALPQGFPASTLPVATVGPLRLHLALGGWGYECDDPTPPQAPATQSTNESSPALLFGDWLADFADSAPDIAATVFAAGIRDEESYLATEATLPPGLRGTLGMVRFLYYTGGSLPDADSVFDFMAVAPPWLLSLPTTTLDISTRSRNCLAAQNISTLSDFSQFSAAQVLKFQNLGRKSFREIGESVLSVLTAGPPKASGKQANSAPLDGPSSSSRHSFTHAIDMSLALLTEHERKLIGLRMGLHGPKRTLDSIANDVSLTRERVRQIESRCVSKMKTLPMWACEFGTRLSRLLEEREDPLPVDGLGILDPWFDGASERPQVFEFAAERLSTPSFHVISEGAAAFASKLRQQEWESAKRSARKLLESLAGQNVPRKEARRLVEGLLPDESGELRSELWFAASRLARFAGAGDNDPLISFGQGAEHIVEAVLAAAHSPLHYTEIHRRIVEAGEQIELRRAHSAARNVGLLYGRGSYGTERHFPLSETEQRLLVSEVEDLVAGNGQDRQWHAREICEALEERGFDFGGRLDPYIVSIALRASRHLAYLGRMVWATASSGAKGTSDRLDVHQAVVATLMAEGRPLSTEEIKTRLSRERGLNVYFQIQPEGPVVRVGIGLWGLEDRDLPFPRDDVEKIVSALRLALSVRGKGLHVTEVVDAVASAVPSVRNVRDPVLLLGLAQKRDGFSVGKGQYLYLSEWETPRRITVYDATIAVLSSAGRIGLSAEDGIPKIEALIERPLGKHLYASSCNNVGALFDENTGRWYLPEPGDDRAEEADSEVEAA